MRKTIYLNISFSGLHKRTLCKMSLIIVLTILCSSRLFRDSHTAPGRAAVHWQAGTLQSAQAWGDRGQSVVWECEATL